MFVFRYGELSLKSWLGLTFVECRDTAGQERFETLTAQYYRRAQVLCVDIHTCTSSQQVPSHCRLYMIIHTHVDGVCMLLWQSSLSRVSCLYMT